MEYVNDADIAGSADMLQRRRANKDKIYPEDEASAKLMKTYRFLQHNERDFNTQVSKVRDRKRFFEAAKSGSPDDILMMLELVHKDYESMVFHRSDERHILNIKNENGLTALYIAARCGNLKVVKFLCKQGCNPYITCREESCLAVAARWNHVGCVEFLLDHIKQPALIREAIAAAGSDIVSAVFEKRGFNKNSSCCTLI